LQELQFDELLRLIKTLLIAKMKF